MLEEKIPPLSASLSPPLIHGAAPLAAWAADGKPVEWMLAQLSGPFADEAAMLGAAYDTAVLAFLSARRDLGLALQQEVLTNGQLFRLRGGSGAGPNRLRILAFLAQGDLQTNMPIEFITEHLPVQLDLLYVLPNQTLPQALPDHDLAICLVSDSDPPTLKRLARLLAQWPRPVINHPIRIAGGQTDNLTRDGIARLFADAPGITVPTTICCPRAQIQAHLSAGRDIAALVPGADWPLLARPVDSHAGRLLERLNDAAALAAYLADLDTDQVYLTRFVDYRDTDGLYRKSRVALIEGRPFLCHVGVCDHWMIHYLNAGMTESAAKRADEAEAMRTFDNGFGRHHAAAFAILADRLGLDYVILDCAEAPDGSLLVFEVEMAAIIHMLDPIPMFDYKQPQMRRVFSAFAEMLQRRASTAKAVEPVFPALLAS